MKGYCGFCRRSLDRCACDYHAALKLFYVLTAITLLGALLRAFAVVGHK